MSNQFTAKFIKTVNEEKIMFKKLSAMLFVIAAILTFSPLVSADQHGMKKDIVDVAAENGSFTTLVAAVKAAGLVDTLKSKGPFTVFAPTDAAFAKLPAGTVDMLLKPENKDKLVAILTYHVVAAKVMAADVVKLDSADTVQGGKVMIMVKDGKVMINNAQVVTADVKASNGVIHVIDTVLMPK
ncbi:beta-Ig-H3/fasciclin [Psychromonas marina]|uniref:Beta-Ig-H3/fasciclin n=2 Tax=Psychromonas marina TaxID=88364 RepID=A0ABQ6E4R6_9GAMM|nr:beta-Ig-H3/fasciclin [Psychromonas marina]